MSEELKLDRYEVTEGGGTFKCPGGEMVYYSDVKSFIADNNAALRAELAALKAGQGEAVAPYGYLREVDGNVQLSIGPARPADRSEGCATPWAAIFAEPPTTAGAVSVPRELLERAIANLALLDSRPRSMCRDCADCNGVCHTTGLDCDVSALTAGLRALLVRQGVKP